MCPFLLSVIFAVCIMNDAQKVDIYFQLCSTLNFQFVQYVNDRLQV